MSSLHWSLTEEWHSFSHMKMAGSPGTTRGSSAKLCVLAVTLGEVGFRAANRAHLNAIVSTSGPHPLGEDGLRKTNLAQISRL